MGLTLVGDYIATFMAWLKDVPAGGATGFTYPEYEDVIEPVKGAAAFWTDLTSGNRKDMRASHAGCPTLAGAKWILNKWINSFDQWNLWPCKSIGDMAHMSIYPRESFALSRFDQMPQSIALSDTSVDPWRLNYF